MGRERLFPDNTIEQSIGIIKEFARIR